MAQSQSRSDGSAVRFNHGVVSEDGQPDVGVATRALRRAIGHADNEDDAATFANLFHRLVEQRQYTEGHHAVTVELSETELNMLHLAHMIAADSIPEFDRDFAKTFREHKQRLPTSA